MPKRRLATVLVIDVAGYSKLMQIDASGVVTVLNEIFRRVVRPQVQSTNGRIVKLLGDGALIEFSSARDGLDCAVAIQQAMRSTLPPYHYSEPIVLRMGLHVGDILVEALDIFGDAPNIAARLQALAEPGGILLSRAVADMAGSNLSFKLRSEGRRNLKNIAEPIEVLAVDFTGHITEAHNHPAQTLEIRYCKSIDGHTLAWASVGNGRPIVKAPNWIGHLELDWLNPGLGPLYESLASHRQLIYFDARGNGLSYWEIPEISFDLLVDDLECVFEAAGVKRAPIIALSQGCAYAAAFAAKRPQRVSAIVMMGGYAIGRARRGSPKDQQRVKAMQAMMQTGWDDDYPSLRDLIAQTIYPDASREDQRRYAEDMRKIITPENLARYRGVIDSLDITELLAQVQCPCLVLHSKGDRMQPIEQGRKLAAGIPDAKFVALDSNNHALPRYDPAWPLFEREIYAFLELHNV